MPAFEDHPQHATNSEGGASLGVGLVWSSSGQGQTQLPPAHKTGACSSFGLLCERRLRTCLSTTCSVRQRPRARRSGCWKELVTLRSPSGSASVQGGEREDLAHGGLVQGGCGGVGWVAAGWGGGGVCVWWFFGGGEGFLGGGACCWRGGPRTAVTHV
jgi:hypothetical protein